MGRQVLGSAMATLSGWIIGWIALELLSWYGNDYFNHWSWYLVWDSLAMFVLMGMLIVPVWSVILLPLYLLVPRSSFLWSPLVCVPLGAFAGFLIMQAEFACQEYVVYHAGGHHAFEFVWLSIPAAIIGGVTCLAGTLTYFWFHPNQADESSKGY
jgi:hypothetical protein